MSSDQNQLTNLHAALQLLTRLTPAITSPISHVESSPVLNSPKQKQQQNKSQQQILISQQSIQTHQQPTAHLPAHNYMQANPQNQELQHVSTGYVSSAPQPIQLLKQKPVSILPDIYKQQQRELHKLKAIHPTIIKQYPSHKGGQTYVVDGNFNLAVNMCPYCSRVFCGKRALDVHILKIHGRDYLQKNAPKQPAANVPFKCWFCSTHFQSPEEVVEHMTVEHENLENLSKRIEEQEVTPLSRLSLLRLPPTSLQSLPKINPNSLVIPSTRTQTHQKNTKAQRSISYGHFQSSNSVDISTLSTCSTMTELPLSIHKPFHQQKRAVHALDQQKVEANDEQKAILNVSTIDKAKEIQDLPSTHNTLAESSTVTTPATIPNEKTLVHPFSLDQDQQQQIADHQQISTITNHPSAAGISKPPPGFKVSYALAYVPVLVPEQSPTSVEGEEILEESGDDELNNAGGVVHLVAENGKDVEQQLQMLPHHTVMHHQDDQQMVDSRVDIIQQELEKGGDHQMHCLSEATGELRTSHPIVTMVTTQDGGTQFVVEGEQIIEEGENLVECDELVTNNHHEEVAIVDDGEQQYIEKE